jgi:TM2 domain-containing membrane protein YozV
VQPFIFDDMRKAIVLIVMIAFGIITCRAESCVLPENTTAGMQTVSLVMDSTQIIEVVVNDTGRGENQKLIAAILAFPVPFGMLGMHRIYLGCEPYVPIVYVVSAGGGCGIIPLIDFIYIIAADEQQLREFKENRGVFMWPKK